MATTDGGPGATEGVLVKDSDNGKVGVVMGSEGPYLQLRPLNGGREWDARPDRIARLTVREEISARLAVQNERSVKRPL
ncbi:hypothetical protein QIS99_31680 [Streptomyces sp. B-S-A8]|uniref:DUF2171 domain-containing protein n=1 Tax=Streptomyces solicavernae TaxID=3043614 RepID=A0ABT6S203_9ACTN|nr:hypothetical protein [Streptomyces sp. B-S-A8]MDI3390723.1 hypothetical protein [Streptomyces sp. B-S-A8]